VDINHPNSPSASVELFEAGTADDTYEWGYRYAPDVFIDLAKLIKGKTIHDASNTHPYRDYSD